MIYSLLLTIFIVAPCGGSDSLNCRLVSHFKTEMDAGDVFIKGEFAYVTEIYSGMLRIIDISDPTLLVEVGHLNTGSFNYDISVVNNVVYIADGKKGGLRIIDVSNPTEPSEICFYELEGVRAFSVWVIDTIAYVVCGGPHWGLHIINVSDPKAPSRVGYMEGISGRLHVEDNILYVGNFSDMKIIKISDLTVPEVIGSYLTDGYEYYVYPQDTLAYLCAGKCGLQILKISDLIFPVCIGQCMTKHCALDVDVKEDVAFVADAKGGIRVINCTNPYEPIEVGYYTGFYALDICVRDTLAFAAGDSGLLVIQYTGNLSDYKFFSISKHLEKEFSIGDLALLDIRQLCLLRNGIFATYGFEFDDPELIKYFKTNIDRFCRNGISGRITDSFCDSLLTEIDWKNIKLIMSLENELKGKNK